MTEKLQLRKTGLLSFSISNDQELEVVRWWTLSVELLSVTKCFRFLDTKVQDAAV